MISPISIATRGFLGNSLKTITIATAGFIFISGTSIKDNEYVYRNSLVTNKIEYKSFITNNLYVSSYFTEWLILEAKFDETKDIFDSQIKNKINLVSVINDNNAPQSLAVKISEESVITNELNFMSNINNLEILTSKFDNAVNLKSKIKNVLILNSKIK
jgi:hypothetical protein